jgi:DNA-directed RNA polymerase subunit RPC12/RpoP
MMVKCEECGSSLVYLDAETDIAWCKNCGYREGVDYRAEP